MGGLLISAQRDRRSGRDAAGVLCRLVAERLLGSLEKESRFKGHEVEQRQLRYKCVNTRDHRGMVC
jgi:hypothetical protein